MVCMLLRYPSSYLLHGIEYQPDYVLLNLTQSKCDISAQRLKTGAIDCKMDP